MASFVTCDKCGAKNRFGTLFCFSCGARMDLAKAKLAGPEGPGILVQIIRWSLFLILLAVLALLCWPASTGGDAPSAGGSEPVIKMANALGSAITRGNEVGMEISEADINAHLTTRLVQPPSADKFKLQLNEVRLNLRPDLTSVWLKNKLGPLTITYTADVSVSRDDEGRHNFLASNFKIGHLPMVGPLRNRVSDQIAAVFMRLREEQSLINRVPNINVIDGVIEFSTIK